MLNLLPLSLKDLQKPPIIGYVLGSLLLTLVLVSGFSLVVFLALKATVLFSQNWLEHSFDAVAVIGTVIVSFVMFPGLVAAAVGLMADNIVAAVENTHYPELPPAKGTSLPQAITASLRFVGVVLGLNLLALPLYILMPGLNLALYYGLNGYLVGREYYEMVALRRATPEQARNWRKEHAQLIWITGALIAFGLTVPLLNLIVPVLGLVAMTHLLVRGVKA